MALSRGFVYTASAFLLVMMLLAFYQFAGYASDRMRRDVADFQGAAEVSHLADDIKEDMYQISESEVGMSVGAYNSSILVWNQTLLPSNNFSSTIDNYQNFLNEKLGSETGVVISANLSSLKTMEMKTEIGNFSQGAQTDNLKYWPAVGVDGYSFFFVVDDAFGPGNLLKHGGAGSLPVSIRVQDSNGDVKEGSWSVTDTGGVLFDVTFNSGDLDIYINDLAGAQPNVRIDSPAEANVSFWVRHQGAYSSAQMGNLFTISSGNNSGIYGARLN